MNAATPRRVNAVQRSNNLSAAAGRLVVLIANFSAVAEIISYSAAQWEGCSCLSHVAQASVVPQWNLHLSRVVRASRPLLERTGGPYTQRREIQRHYTNVVTLRYAL